MLLACCFRGPSRKKHKKNKSLEATDDEEHYVLAKDLCKSKTVSGSRYSKIQDNTTENESPKSNERKLKLRKEREELQVKRKSFLANNVPFFNVNTSTPHNKGQPHKAGSPGFTNISNIHPHYESARLPRDVSRMFASAEDLEGSLLSVASSQKCVPVNTRSTVLRPVSASTKDSNQSLHQFPSQHSDLSKVCSLETQNSEQLGKINSEKRQKRDVKDEEIVRKFRANAEKEIEALKIQHQIDIEKVKESYNALLLEEKEKFRKNLEKEIIDAKNNANQTLSQLNQELLDEKDRIFVQNKNECDLLEVQIKAKTNQVNESLKLVETREKAWREEKDEVLKEVQRLKAEASKMVKILAMEYEEENLTEEKKRSLTQEVYSLQLVVEMRTGETRSLKDQLAKTMRKLEDAQEQQEKLRRMEAKVEDLEEQLRQKNVEERALQHEKTELEKSLETSNREANRMSQNIESLQWRIKNNYNLPILEQISWNHKKISDIEPEQLDSPDDIPPTHTFDEIPFKDLTIKEQNIEANDNFLVLSAGMHAGYENENETPVSEEDEENENDNSDDSLDEGLGDISSDGEIQENKTCEDQKGDPDELEKRETSILQKEKERIPSIF